MFIIPHFNTQCQYFGHLIIHVKYIKNNNACHCHNFSYIAQYNENNNSDIFSISMLLHSSVSLEKLYKTN